MELGNVQVAGPQLRRAKVGKRDRPLVVVDAARKAYFGDPVRQNRYFESFALVRAARDAIVNRLCVEGSHDT